MTQAPIYLVADVGGTNTRVSLTDGALVRTGTVERYRNADFESLPAVLQAHLERFPGVALDGVCAALAGPVDGTSGGLTNLDWTVTTDALAAAVDAPKAALLNDLQAQGHGLVRAQDLKLRPLLSAEQSPPAGTKLVIGVGTGFNIAAVHQSPAGTLVTISEAGHAGLPVASRADLDLVLHLAEAHGFGDIEEALSGRGLEAIYRFHSGGEHRAASEIVRGLGENDPLVAQTVQTFARMLGMVAGNLALTFLPYGGIYFSGGVSRALAGALPEAGFTQAFHHKGRFSHMMKRFEIQVIDDDFAALAGCAGHLAQHQ